jgi:hypothetical protein
MSRWLAPAGSVNLIAMEKSYGIEVVKRSGLMCFWFVY